MAENKATKFVQPLKVEIGPGKHPVADATETVKSPTLSSITKEDSKRLPSSPGVTLYIPKERGPGWGKPRKGRCCGLCKPPPGFFELLNPIDFDRLVDLRRRMHIPYDTTSNSHMKMLIQLWSLAYPETADRITPKSRHWRQLGFQNDDPSTDFRGAGVYALHTMLYFATSNSELFKDIILRGRTYPFAAACINVIHIIKFHVGLAHPDETSPGFIRHTPSPRIVKNFVHLFIAYEHVVEKIFCCCVKLVDIFWKGLLLSPVPKKNSRRNSIFRRASLATAVSSLPAAPPEPSPVPDAVAELYGEEPSNDDIIQGMLPPKVPLPAVEIAALLDFPTILEAVRARLDRALAAFDPETGLWSSFENSLLYNAEGQRFKRTPV